MRLGERIRNAVIPLETSKHPIGLIDIESKSDITLTQIVNPWEKKDAAHAKKLISWHER